LPDTICTYKSLIDLINEKWENVRNAVENILRGKKEITAKYYERRGTCGYVCRWDFVIHKYMHYLLKYHWGMSLPIAEYYLPLHDNVEYDIAFLYDALWVFDMVELDVLR
jgi:hypothetical protein